MTTRFIMQNKQKLIWLWCNYFQKIKHFCYETHILNWTRRAHLHAHPPVQPPTAAGRFFSGYIPHRPQASSTTSSMAWHAQLRIG